MRDPQQGVGLPVSNTGLFMIGATARWIEDYDRYCGQKSRWAIFRQVRHWLVANDGNPVLIGQLLDYCYPRRSRHPRWHRTNIHRCLSRYAVPIRRLDYYI